MFDWAWKRGQRRIGKTGEKLPEGHDGLPDSTLPHGLCPRCEKQSSFDVAGWQPITFDPDSHVVSSDGTTTKVHLDQVSVLYCRSCRQGIVVVEEQHSEGCSWRVSGPQRSGSITWRGIHWWPASGTIIKPDVPPAIAEAFQESIRALHAQCPRASAAMARRTLEVITWDKGARDSTLAKRLTELSASGVLLPTLADWSKEVRLVGNAATHFDLMQTVSKEDAEQLVAFVRELLRYLYELPAELARRRGT